MYSRHIIAQEPAGRMHCNDWSAAIMSTVKAQPYGRQNVTCVFRQFVSQLGSDDTTDGRGSSCSGNNV